MQQVRAVVALKKGDPVSIETINVPDPGPGEAVVAGPGLRGLPHRPALPRGRHQRRLPVPARPRGGGHRRGRRGRRHERGARRLRDPQLARGLRRLPGLQPRRAVVLLRHLQRHPEDDPRGRHRALARRSASARSPRRRWSPRASAPRSTRRPGRRPRGLLGCGVMAGLGAAMNTGNVRPRQVRRRDRLRRRRRRRGRRVGAGRRRQDHRRRHRRPEARGRAQAGRDPHRQQQGHRPGRRRSRTLTGGFGADVVIDAVGVPETWKQAFYARDLAGTVVLVGVPTPDMKIPDIPLIDVFGRGGSLKSSWYGDCLPSRDFPMLVDLYQQGRLDLDAFVSEEIGLGRRRGGVRQDARRRRAPLGGDPVMPARDRPRRLQRHLHPRRRDVRRRQQHLGGRRRRGVRGHRRAARRRRHPGRRRRPEGQGDPAAPTRTTTTCRVAPALREKVVAPIMLHPDDRPLWELTHTDHLWDVDLADGFEIDRGRHHAARAAHAGSRARRGLLLRARPRLRLHRRHPVQRRPGRHRALVQRRGPDQGVDPGPAVRAARRHGRAHRPRRRHHDRRGAGWRWTASRDAAQNGWTSSAIPCPRARVSTIVASSSPARASRLRSWSGTTSTPRFLIVSLPMPRSRRAARSAFSR